MSTIAALLSTPEMQQRLRAALKEGPELSLATTWADLRQLANQPSTRAVIADPLADKTAGPVVQIARLHAELRAPLIIYTSLSPEAAPLLMDLGQLGVRRVLFHRFDDAPRAMRAVFAAEGVDLSPTPPAEPVEPRIIRVGSIMSDQLIHALARDPDLLYGLAPRTFEELVAELLHRHGFRVTLTSATRDGGKDIVVACTTTIGSFAYYVECKRFNAQRPVGLPIVRELYGAVQADRVTGGILATTSFFTRDALAFQSRVPYQISLKDFADLAKWLTAAIEGDPKSSAFNQ